MTTKLTGQQRQHWDEEGYVIVRNAVDGDLIKAMVAAVEQILDLAAADEFDDTVKWIDREHRVAHFLSDLLTPQKYAPAFGVLMNSVTLPFMEDLLQEPLRTSWLMLLTGGAGHEYTVPLHRDNNKVGGDNELELIEQYNDRQCYFQAPLLPDRFLQVVPGSHLRGPTEAEKEAAASVTACTTEEVEGLMLIELEPGDVVYRHTNLLHQGCNPNGLPRWTLVSASWSDTQPIVQVEQKDYAALSAPGFCDVLPPRCQASVKRYLRAFEEGRKE